MSVRYLPIVFILTVVAAVCFSVGSARAEEPDTEPPVERQDPSTNPTPDNALIANETGLPLSEIDSAIAFQDTFAEYADGLLEQFPGQISAIWMDSPLGAQGPSTRGHVRFVGDVPSGVNSTGNIFLTGGGAISMDDHKLRAEAAADALTGLGYQNLATFFDPGNNVIRVELLLPQGATQPTEASIVQAVQGRVAAAQSLTGRAGQVNDSDLKLTVLEGSGPFVIDHHSRGGNWLRYNSRRRCTSGWSVSGSDGDGILTAAHCNVNKFEQPGVTPYSMDHIDQEWGAKGDVEYLTTSHEELAEFYSDATKIRDVTGTKSTSSMPGGSVCFYGRSSDDRTCSIEVEAINVTVVAGGVTVSSLARTDDTPSISGDSGGGWSRNFTAWGINKGHDNQGKGYFTPVEVAEDALDVTIKTQ